MTEKNTSFNSNSNQEDEILAQELKTIYQIFTPTFKKSPLLKGIILPKPFYIIKNKKVPDLNYETGFFREPNLQANFKYLWACCVEIQDIKIAKKTIKPEHRFDFDIPPVLCSDNILYFKTGNILGAISFDEKQPCFIKKNIKTKTSQKLNWHEVQHIVGKWLDFSSQATTLLSKLRPLHQNLQRNQAPQEKPHPSFEEVYTLHSLKLWHSTLKPGTRHIQFSVPPTICQGNQMFAKSGPFIYRIEAGKIIKFDKLVQNESSLMTPQEVREFLSEALINGVISKNVARLLQKHYETTHIPLFQKGYQQRIPSSKRETIISSHNNYKVIKKQKTKTNKPSNERAGE